MIVHNWHGTRFRRSKHSHRENVKLSSVGWTKESGYAAQVHIYLRDDDVEEVLSVKMNLADAINLRERLDSAINGVPPEDRIPPPGRPF